MFNHNLTLPYSSLNLRLNPFGEADLAQRRDLVFVDHVVPDKFLKQQRHLVQILGKVGCGKTSCLLGLLSIIPDSVYIRFSDGYHSPLPADKSLLLDEYDLLSKRQRTNFLRNFQIKAVSTHVDFSHEFRRLQYTITSFNPAERMTVDRLEQIVQRRLEWARRGPGPIPVIPKEKLEYLLERYDNNIRLIENALYDMIQEWEEVHYVKM